MGMGIVQNVTSLLPGRYFWRKSKKRLEILQFMVSYLQERGGGARGGGSRAEVCVKKIGIIMWEFKFL